MRWNREGSCFVKMDMHTHVLACRWSNTILPRRTRTISCHSRPEPGSRVWTFGHLGMSFCARACCPVLLPSFIERLCWALFGSTFREFMYCFSLRQEKREPLGFGEATQERTVFLTRRTKNVLWVFLVPAPSQQTKIHECVSFCPEQDVRCSRIDARCLMTAMEDAGLGWLTMRQGQYSEGRRRSLSMSTLLRKRSTALTTEIQTTSRSFLRQSGPTRSCLDASSACRSFV